MLHMPRNGCAFTAEHAADSFAQRHWCEFRFWNECLHGFTRYRRFATGVNWSGVVFAEAD